MQELITARLAECQRAMDYHTASLQALHGAAQALRGLEEDLRNVQPKGLDPAPVTLAEGNDVV